MSIISCFPVTTPRSRPTSGRRRARSQTERKPSTSGSNSCVSSDHESTYSEDDSQKGSDEGIVLITDSKETPVVAFYVASSSTSDDDQSAAVSTSDSEKAVARKGAKDEKWAKIGPDKDSTKTIKLNKFEQVPETVCDGKEQSLCAYDEPVFSTRKSPHELNSEMLPSEHYEDSGQSNEKVTRTVSINEGDCEMMDIESDESKKGNSEDSAVEMTQSNEVDNNNDLNVEDIRNIEPLADQINVVVTETDTKEYSDDFDTDSKCSDEGKVKLELLATPAEVVGTDSEIDMVVSDQDEPMVDMKLGEIADVTPEVNGRTDRAAEISVNNVRDSGVIPGSAPGSTTGFIPTDLPHNDNLNGFTAIENTESTELDAYVDKAVPNLVLNDFESASDVKDYSDDFDSTDSHTSWEAVTRLKLLHAPVEVVQTDSELDMTVSDHDEPLMKLDDNKCFLNQDVCVDLDATLVFKTVREQPENPSEAASKKLDEVLTETVSELGLPHLLVTTTEREVKEYSDDFDSDDKSSGEDGDRLKALNVPVEEVKTDSEMELGTSDQEDPLLDLNSSALIKEHEDAPILYKPPTHPEVSYSVAINYNEEEMYSDDFDFDGKISDDGNTQNKLKLLNLPVEVVNTDSELELATNDHKEPLLDVSTGTEVNKTMKPDNLTGDMAGNFVSDSIPDGACNNNANHQSSFISTESVEQELFTNMHMSELHHSKDTETVESRLVDDVMDMVTISSVAPDVVVTEENRTKQDQEMYSDDFDSDSKSSDEELDTKGSNIKSGLLNLLLEVVATDSEMEIGTSDQEEPLMNLSSGIHDSMTQTLEVQRSTDSSGAEDAEEFAEGLKKESTKVSSPRSKGGAGKNSFNLKFANGGCQDPI